MSVAKADRDKICEPESRFVHSLKMDERQRVGMQTNIKVAGQMTWKGLEKDSRRHPGDPRARARKGKKRG
jgi:hypothetical protein